MTRVITAKSIPHLLEQLAEMIPEAMNEKNDTNNEPMTPERIKQVESILENIPMAAELLVISGRYAMDNREKANPAEGFGDVMRKHLAGYTPAQIVKIAKAAEWADGGLKHLASCLMGEAMDRLLMQEGAPDAES